MHCMMDFDPMLLESGLHYPETRDETLLVICAKANGVEEDACVEITEAGEMETSPLDLSQPLELGMATEPQSPEEYGPYTLAQPVGKCTIINQEQQEGSALNPPAEGEKKRKNWSDEETEVLLEAFISQGAKPKSRLDNEPFWSVISKRVPRRTGRNCRMRMETLKKSHNAVKFYCEKEKKKFSDLNGADFEKMKLASRIIESWYNRIRDHWSPRPTKKSRDQGVGSSSASGEVGRLLEVEVGEVSGAVVAATKPPPVSQCNTAFGEVVCQAPVPSEIMAKHDHHPTWVGDDGPSAPAPHELHHPFPALAGGEDPPPLPISLNDVIAVFDLDDPPFMFQWRDLVPCPLLLDEDVGANRTSPLFLKALS